MKTIRIDDRTVRSMAQVAMELYEIPIDVDDPNSVRAGMKEFFDRLEMDPPDCIVAWSKNLTHK